MRLAKEGYELGTNEQRGALLGMLVDEAECTIEGLSLEYEQVAQTLPARIKSAIRRRVVDQTIAQGSQVVDEEYGMYIDGAIATLPFDTQEFAFSLAIRQGRDYWIAKVKSVEPSIRRTAITRLTTFAALEKIHSQPAIILARV